MISHVHFCGYPKVVYYYSSLYSGCFCTAEMLTLFDDDNKLCLINKASFEFSFSYSSYSYSWTDCIDLLKIYYF